MSENERDKVILAIDRYKNWKSSLTPKLLRTLRKYLHPLTTN
ncbi:hypothetical protein [Scytonema sp. NUACC26]